MKTMKKLMAILMAALMTLTLAGAAFAEGGMIGMANPWTETTEEGFIGIMGLELAIPEGAENVAFRVLEAEQLGEMTFTLDGMDYVARVKPAVEFEDISGLYYAFENPIEDEAVAGLQTWEGRATDGEETIDLALWFDVVPGIMYSLSTSGADLDGFDIIGVALQVYQPMQGDA